MCELRDATVVVLIGLPSGIPSNRVLCHIPRDTNREHLFLGALQKWRLERGWDPNNPTRRVIDSVACERIVVLNKRDLVPEWGLEVILEPF